VDERQELLIGSAWLKVVGRSSLAKDQRPGAVNQGATANDEFLQTSGCGNSMADVAICGFQRALGLGTADLRLQHD
jgi:hypothetical protein